MLGRTHPRATLLFWLAGGSALLLTFAATTWRGGKGVVLVTFGCAVLVLAAIAAKPPAPWVHRLVLVFAAAPLLAIGVTAFGPPVTPAGPRGRPGQPSRSVRRDG